MLTAAIVSGAYLALATVYISLSTRLAHDASSDVASLAAIEEVKGIVFIVGTSLFIFGALLLLLSEIHLKERQLSRQRERSIANERHATVSVSVASVAHDLNNLLGLCRSLLVTVDPKYIDGPDGKQKLQQAMRLMEEMVIMNRRMIDASRQRLMSDGEEFDVAAEVARAVSTVRIHPQVKQSSLSLDLANGCRICGDARLLQNSVINLLINAAEAAKGVDIKVVVHCRSNKVIVEVHDAGPGVPVEARENVFHAFHSSKTNGSGLGLVTVKAFAESHGGHVEIRDSPLGGACFRIVLPNAASMSPQETQETQEARPHNAHSGRRT